ncbi:hypothetical protein PTKIN_Ptkin18bG0113000 [Pterospermum kingtungense]
MFNMENKSKGIAWVGDIYQKFEAMCLEVDDMVCQETLKYVGNQLHTVGANVQQFCSELMQEVIPSSPTKLVEDLNSSPVQNAGIIASKGSNITVDEDHSQKELIHPSSRKSVNYESFDLSSEQSKEDESALVHCSGSMPSDPVNLVAVNNHLRDIDSTLDDTSLESTGKRRSYKVYKKKFREAFSSKPRSGKRNNEQHAESGKDKGNGVGLSGETNKSESPDMEFCESDWEII